MASSVAKGNASSSDNTLAFPIHPNSREPTQSFATSATSNTTNSSLQSPAKYYSSEQSNLKTINNLRTTPTKFYDTDKYLKSNQFNSASNNQEFVNNSTNQFESTSNGFNYAKQLTASPPQQQMLQTQRSPSQSDLRFDVDYYNKQAYKNALDQQVIEKELTKFEQLRANKKSELETMSQYPFGRRTDPNSYIISETRYIQPFVNTTSYQPDFFNTKSPFFRDDSSSAPKLDKNNIFEKPNSLSADIPPYDPIKHRNGFHQGYTYDPWGKPGGGAPLIDSSTGRKYTKITGQVGFDQMGITPEDRAKLVKAKPLTLEEQKHEVNAEKERKRVENEVYKQRAGDLATWITDLENMRRNHSMATFGAHLPITNVTRDKIGLESVRRSQDEKAKLYHNQLEQQLEEKNREKKLYKLKDDVAGIEHTRKWNDLWGKPGGGAPNIDRRRRDLTEVLQSPRDHLFSGTATSLPIGSPNLAKSNSQLNKNSIKSDHTNLYDNVTIMKLN